MEVRILNKTIKAGTTYIDIEMQACPICKKPMEFDKDNQQYYCEKDGVCYNV